MIAYRPEIDGLRAVAIASVLLFHAGFGVFGGGYVGVDVFFVLSGYLITSLILQDAGRGGFSYLDFYERRIRRLLPPLIPVLAVTGAAAFLVLDQDQFDTFSHSFLSTLLFAANWHLLSTVGYFDGPGELTPLLHMWSLAIEEQFYFVFPAILLAARRTRWLRLACLALLTLSFAYALTLMSRGDDEVAFFSSLARFWELLVGVLLALSTGRSLSEPRVADAMEIGGAAMILAAIFLYDSQTPFPGLAALPPTLGTALIIGAAGKGRIISPILKSRPLVAVGMLSYSLYLWHWPILVFIRILMPSAGNLSMLVGIAVSAVLSMLSFRWIERPIRQKRALRRTRSAYVFAVGSLVTLALLISLSPLPVIAAFRLAVVTDVRLALYDGERTGAIAGIEREKSYYMSQFNLNYNGQSGPYDPAKHRRYTCSFDGGSSVERVRNCLVAQAGERNILVIGDSIGRDTLHALNAAYPQEHFLMVHQSGCPPADFVQAGGKRHCFAGLQPLLDSLRSNVPIQAIVLAFRYRPKEWKNVESGIRAAKTLTDKVVLLGAAPVFRQTISQFILGLPSGQPMPSAVLESNRAMVGWNFEDLTTSARRMAAANNISFVDVEIFFCRSRQCDLWEDQEKARPLFWDQQHLTQFGIEAFSRFLSQQATLIDVIGPGKPQPVSSLNPN